MTTLRRFRTTSTSRGLLPILHYGWRVLATGISFLVLEGLGSLLGLILTVCIFPLPMSLQRKYRVIRHLLSDVFKIYLSFLRLTGLLTCEFRDSERLQGEGQLIIANHPSLLDVAFLISRVKRANCVIKQGVRENKFTFIPTKIAGYITNEDDDMMSQCQRSLAQGDSLIIFPEGTRSTPGEPVKLTRGFANIAIMARHNITPVFIHCDPPTLIKGQKWYEIPPQKPHFHLQVLPEIDITPYLAQPRSKAARQLTRDVEALYNARALQLD